MESTSSPKKNLGLLVKLARNNKSKNINKKYTQLMLAQDIGVSQSYIGDIESGRAYPSISVLVSIAEACGVPFDFFHNAFGTIEEQDAIKKLSSLIKKRDRLKEISDELNAIKDTIVDVPIWGFVPAGMPILVDENYEGTFKMPFGDLKGKDDYFLKIRGDSMDDIGISDGDMILVHPQSVAENGQTVIARINGEITCKRFYKTNGECRLEPANKKYKPINCNEVEIIGIVIKLIRDMF